MLLPISMSIVHKDKLVEQNGKQHRKSSKTKTSFVEQFLQAIHNEVLLNTVLGDIWFGNVHGVDKLETIFMPKGE